MTLFVTTVCCLIQTVSAAPKLDGRIAQREYGEPVVEIAKPGAPVTIRLARHGGHIYIGISVPDSTYYWGDDVVISLDPDGSGGSSPGAGDRQWYLRRTADSSVVMVASGLNGRWYDTEPARLGANREGEHWKVAARSERDHWIVELRISEGIMGANSKIAFRTFDDNPQGWWSLPAPHSNVPAQRIERIPDLWLSVRLN